ncbi:MAG: UpxY family transcription antiterminator [Thermodesulfovibrionales bacterium]
MAEATIPIRVYFEGGGHGRRAMRTRWYALYVRSRHEFVVRDELLRKGTEAYLPSVSRLRQWKDRKKSVEFPLFPGYLFVRTEDNPEAHIEALRTRGVVAFVSLEGGRPTPVPDHEIDSLRVLLDSGREIDVYPGLKEGSRVRIRRGALVGAEGMVSGKEEGYTFLVNIELLGRSIGVRIYAEDLEAA